MDLIKIIKWQMLLWGMFLFFPLVKAQNQRIDSLENILKNYVQPDTTKVNILNEIAYSIYAEDAKKAKAYAEQSEEISDKIHYLKGKATSLRIIGLATLATDKKMALRYFEKALCIAGKRGYHVEFCYCLMAIGNVKKSMGDAQEGDEAQRKGLQIARKIQNPVLIAKFLYNISQNESHRGNYQEAIKLIQEAIIIESEVGDISLFASMNARLAAIYYYLGNFPAALEYNLFSLRAREQINDRSGIFTCLVNIAGVQSSQKDFVGALKTLQKAYVLSENMNDSVRMSVCFTNMGNIYLEMDDPRALEYFLKSLDTAKDNDIQQNINTLMNIGQIYVTQKKFDESLNKLEEALALAQKISLKRAYGEIWTKMGSLYYAQKQYDQAMSYTQKALDLAEEFRYLELEKDCHKQLSDIYAAMGIFNNAYQNHVRYKLINDSLFNEENIRKMAALESSYAYDKDRQKHEMEKVNQEMKIKNQKYVILFLAIISFFILILAFTIYWSNKLKKKVLKLEIENMNRELESNQKAMAAATLKLIQNSERDAYSIKMLENIKKNTIEDGQTDVRTLISEYKLKSYNSNWDEFEILFEKVNASFYETLNERYPTLTPNERKLCVFLKLNMSNKHISQVTFQSEEALKKARLRLRKKLDIDRDTNLVTFIQNL